MPSVYDMMMEKKKKYNTVDNTFEMFPVGTPVQVITPCQDFHFFYDETGKVISNSGKYLGIVVEFDEPRHFTNGHIQKSFGFQPDDLIDLSLSDDLFKIS